MNRRQGIVLGLGIAWIGLALLMPPVLVPAAGRAGATRPFIEYVPWTSQVVQIEGVATSQLATEVVSIAFLMAAGMYGLRSRTSRQGPA